MSEEASSPARLEATNQDPSPAMTVRMPPGIPEAVRREVPVSP